MRNQVRETRRCAAAWRGVLLATLVATIPSQAFAEQDRYVAGDFNGDGFADILKLAKPYLYLSRSDGKGGWTSYQRIPGGEDLENLQSAHVSSGDINGDGLADLLLLRRKLGAQALEVVCHVSYASGFYPGIAHVLEVRGDPRDYQLICKDFDGDGKADLCLIRSRESRSGPDFSVYLRTEAGYALKTAQALQASTLQSQAIQALAALRLTSKLTRPEDMRKIGLFDERLLLVEKAIVRLLQIDQVFRIGRFLSYITQDPSKRTGSAAPEAGKGTSRAEGARGSGVRPGSPRGGNPFAMGFLLHMFVDIAREVAVGVGIHVAADRHEGSHNSDAAADKALGLAALRTGSTLGGLAGNNPIDTNRQNEQKAKEGQEKLKEAQAKADAAQANYATAVGNHEKAMKSGTAEEQEKAKKELEAAREAYAKAQKEREEAEKKAKDEEKKTKDKMTGDPVRDLQNSTAYRQMMADLFEMMNRSKRAGMNEVWIYNLDAAANRDLMPLARGPNDSRTVNPGPDGDIAPPGVTQQTSWVDESDILARLLARYPADPVDWMAGTVEEDSRTPYSLEGWVAPDEVVNPRPDDSGGSGGEGGDSPGPRPID